MRAFMPITRGVPASQAIAHAEAQVVSSTTSDEPPHADQLAHLQACSDHAAIAAQPNHAALGCRLDMAPKRLHILFREIAVHSHKMLAVLKGRALDVGAVSGSHSCEQDCEC